jgi:hypothetical protein
VQQRDFFLRDIAAARTRARRLIWFGFTMFVIGLAAFAVPLRRFLTQVDKGLQSSDPTESVPDSPWSIRGYPVGLVG